MLWMIPASLALATLSDEARYTGNTEIIWAWRTWTAMADFVRDDMDRDTFQRIWKKAEELRKKKEPPPRWRWSQDIPENIDYEFRRKYSGKNKTTLQPRIVQSLRDPITCNYTVKVLDEILKPFKCGNKLIYSKDSQEKERYPRHETYPDGSLCDAHTWTTAHAFLIPCYPVNHDGKIDVFPRKTYWQRQYMVTTSGTRWEPPDADISETCPEKTLFEVGESIAKIFQSDMCLNDLEYYYDERYEPPDIAEQLQKLLDLIFVEKIEVIPDLLGSLGLLTEELLVKDFHAISKELEDQGTKVWDLYKSDKLVVERCNQASILEIILNDFVQKEIDATTSRLVTPL